jgi:hypothetical protein
MQHMKDMNDIKHMKFTRSAQTKAPAGESPARAFQEQN